MTASFPKLKLETWNLKLQRGFTLIELLVVIAIIGILAALLMSGLSRAKDRAIRIKCLSNIKQVDLGLINYALDNKDRLPFGIGGEPSEIPEYLTGVFRSYGITRDILFDPGFPQWNNETNWNDLSDMGVNREIGYVLTWPGNLNLLPGNRNATIIPQPILVGANIFLPAPDPSRRVLVAGMVASGNQEMNPDPALRGTYNYTRLKIEYDLLYRCAHLTGNMPAGDNLGMLDGSGGWRKFKAMVPVSGGGGWVTLWW